LVIEPSGETEEKSSLVESELSLRSEPKRFFGSKEPSGSAPLFSCEFMQFVEGQTLDLEPLTSSLLRLQMRPLIEKSQQCFFRSLSSFPFVKKGKASKKGETPSSSTQLAILSVKSLRRSSFTKSAKIPFFDAAEPQSTPPTEEKDTSAVLQDGGRNAHSFASASPSYSRTIPMDDDQRIIYSRLDRADENGNLFQPFYGRRWGAY
jgi:hypothetical protein